MAVNDAPALFEAATGLSWLIVLGDHWSLTNNHLPAITPLSPSSLIVYDVSSLKSPSAGDYMLHDLNLSPLGSRFVRDRPGRARKRKRDGSAVGDVEDCSEIVEKMTRTQSKYNKLASSKMRKLKS